MKTQWTTYEGRPFRQYGRKDPRVTIGPKGVIYLNGTAVKALGHASAVELLYDGNRRIIGLKRTDPHKKNAFRLAPHQGNYRRISAAAFCQHFRLKFRTTQLFDGVDLDNDGVLLLDLNQTSTVTRGAR